MGRPNRYGVWIVSTRNRQRDSTKKAGHFPCEPVPLRRLLDLDHVGGCAGLNLADPLDHLARKFVNGFRVRGVLAFEYNGLTAIPWLATLEFEDGFA